MAPVVLMVGKVVRIELDAFRIGGSGGVFAPSLFIGAMGAMAFGAIVTGSFRPSGISPAILGGWWAMGAVFGAAAQAPLTAIASVVGDDGQFHVDRASHAGRGIVAASVEKAELREYLHDEAPSAEHRYRETEGHECPADADRVSDVMMQLSETDGDKRFVPREPPLRSTVLSVDTLANVSGLVTEVRRPQTIFSDETLDQALRQLVLYGRVGLPVLSPDGQHLRGWITRHNVLCALSERIDSSANEAEQGRLAAEFSEKDAASRLPCPSHPAGGLRSCRGRNQG